MTGDCTSKCMNQHHCTPLNILATVLQVQERRVPDREGGRRARGARQHLQHALLDARRLRTARGTHQVQSSLLMCVCCF